MMRRSSSVYVLIGLLAGVLLIGCAGAEQSADDPLPSVEITVTGSDRAPNITESAASTAIAASDKPVSEVPGTTVFPPQTHTPSAETSRSSSTDSTVESTPKTTAQKSESLSDKPNRSDPSTTKATPEPSKPPVTSQTPAATTEEVLPEPEIPHHHSYTSQVTKAATCTADGVKTYTCSVCGNKRTESIPATGHSYDSGKITTQPTCEGTGVKTYTCKNCKGTKTESIPAVGHNWDEWIVVKQATTETEGIESRTCSKCGRKETRSMAKLPAENASPADCEWMADYFLQLYNNERAKLGVQQLVTDAKLHEMAQVRADELAVSFDHFRPDGRNGGTVFDDFKYGIYHDFTVVGLPASYNYYEPEYANEAIGAYVYSGSITPKEIIVQSVLEALKSHEAHWSYMKDDIYGAVGIAVSAKKSEEYPGYYEFYFEVLLSDRLYD